jgi:formate dehydrogenase iron-sulfur subunit
VASGIALIMLMSILISYFFNRPYNWDMLADLGKVLAGALFVYYGLRIGDVIVRGNLGLAFSGPDGARFLVEIIGGGLIPLVFLSSAGLRKNKNLLTASVVLSLFGIIFNRLNVVLLGMNLPGTSPGGVVGTYYPTAVEWALVISLIAALFFFFGLGVKLLPIMPAVGEVLKVDEKLSRAA